MWEIFVRHCSICIRKVKRTAKNYRFCLRHRKHRPINTAPTLQKANIIMVIISKLLQNVALCADLGGNWPKGDNSIIRGIILLISHLPLGYFCCKICCCFNCRASNCRPANDLNRNLYQK